MRRLCPFGEDNWIPGLESVKIGHPGMLESQMLEKGTEIMDKRTRDWSLDSTEHWLTEEQFRAVKEIPICQHRGKDVMV